MGHGIAPGGDALDVGQLACVEFTTRSGRGVRLFGCIAEITEEHLLVDSLEGGSTRPDVGERVTVTTQIGRTVHTATTPVILGSDSGSRRLMLRCPVAFLGNNRRRHERRPLDAAVTWFDVDASPIVPVSGRTKDVSIGGMLFLTKSESVAVGQRVVVVLDHGDRRVAGVAEVRSRRGERDVVSVGIEWVALADLDRAALALAAQL